jgi:two-component system phosphate regulon sensor histidine kinase PhoR
MAPRTLWRPRFLWRLFGGSVLVVVLTAVILGLVFMRLITAEALRATERQLRDEAQLLKEVALPALRDWEGAGLQQAVQETGRSMQARLTVIRADGVVLADSEEDPLRMANHLSRPEVQQAGRQGWGQARRQSRTLGVEMMYCAVPVIAAGRTLGYARAAMPLTAIQHNLEYLRSLIVLWALGAVVAAAVVAFLIARHVSGPVAGMVRSMHMLAASGYGQDLGPLAVGELGELVRGFNRLSAELRQRIDAITSEHNQLEAILAGMVEGVIAVDSEERVVHLNHVAAQVFGVEPVQCLGRRIWELIRVPALNDTVGTTMRDAVTTRAEIRLTQQGQDTLLELHASPLRDAHGSLVGAVVVLHDVTELRRLETVRREFVANVSHELKTPLTAVHGLAETLLDDEEMPHDTQRRFLGKICGQSARLTALVGDLLTLSHIESEESALERVRLDLREPLQESAQALATAAEEHGLALELQLPAAPVAVLGDHEALRQIVGNLLDNAIKYTPAGGRVSLCLRSGNGRALIEVRDTGIGIEPQEQQRIFERFYRVDKARSRELGGTGLGLSIVKHLTLALDGQVSVESMPGRGSTFIVQLPLAAGPLPGLPATSPQA